MVAYLTVAILAGMDMFDVLVMWTMFTTSLIMWVHRCQSS
jgi:hypothetical protein